VNIKTFKQASIEKRVAYVGLMTAITITLLNILLKVLGVDTAFHTYVLGVPTDVAFLVLLMFIFIGIDGHAYIRTHQKEGTHTAFAVGSITAMFAVVFTLIFHEFGHGVMMRYFNHSVDHAGISWWGAYVAGKESILQVSPLEEIMISLAGPGTNFIIGLILMAFVRLMPESVCENSVQYVSHMNIRLARWNMYPILFFDGGKALDGVIRTMVNGTVARGIVTMISIFAILYFYRMHRAKHKPLEDVLVTL